MAPRSNAESPTTRPTWPCLRLEGQGERRRIVIDLSVSPNAKRTEPVGWHDVALRLRISAPPVEGAANEAIRRWLSKGLDLPPSHIELLRGAASRRKQWSLNTDPDKVHHWIEGLIDSGQLPSPTS